MFIAILTYKKPLVEVDRFLQAHRDFLAEHYAAGDFISSGPQNPRNTKNFSNFTFGNHEQYLLFPHL